MAPPLSTIDNGSNAAATMTSSARSSMANDALMLPCSPSFFDYDVYNVNVTKSIGVPVNLGLALLIDKTISPDILRVLPHSTAMVTVKTIENGTLQKAGIRERDLFVDRMGSKAAGVRKTADQGPFWKLLSPPELRAKIAASVSFDSFSFFVARKKVAMEGAAQTTAPPFVQPTLSSETSLAATVATSSPFSETIVKKEPSIRSNRPSPNEGAGSQVTNVPSEAMEGTGRHEQADTSDSRSIHVSMQPQKATELAVNREASATPLPRIDMARDAVMLPCGPPFLDYSVYKVTVSKAVGVPVELGLRLDIEKTIPPEILQALPDSKEMVSVIKIKNRALETVGVCEHDVLIERSPSSKTFHDEPFWNLLSFADLRTSMASSVDKRSFTIFMARKKAIEQEDAASPAVQPSILSGTRSPRTAFATSRTSGPSRHSRAAEAPTLPSTRFTVFFTGSLKNTYDVYRVMMSKVWTAPVALGLIIAYSTSLSHDERRIFPNCSEIAFIQEKLESGALADANVRVGDILLRRSKSAASTPLGGRISSDLTLMTMRQFDDAITASRNMSYFEFYVGRKIAKSSSDAATASALAIDASRMDSTNNAAPVDNIRRSRDTYAGDCDHERLPKRSKPPVPLDRGQHTLPLSVARRITMTPTPFHAPASIEPLANQQDAVAKISKSADTAVNVPQESDLHQQTADPALSENKLLHDECSKLVQTIQEMQSAAIAILNSMQTFDTTLAKVKCASSGMQPDQLYNSLLYPILAAPAVPLLDTASRASFADHILKQSAALRSVKQQLLGEKERRTSMLQAMRGDCAVWLKEVIECRQKLRGMRSKAMADFNLQAKP